MAKRQPTIKKHLSPPESVIRGDIKDSLGSVLSLVHSSHEAVFIFDKDEFIGLISPFQTLYSRNYPYTTRVSSIVFKAPAITEETPIYEAAEHMLAAKIYVLPILSKAGRLKSVIYGKDILREITQNPDLLRFVSSNVHPQTPITASNTASAKEVFHTLKNKGVSRMVIVDAEGDLAGIVTRSDLMHSLIAPTPKMRFPKEGTHAGYYSLAGEKKFRKEEPISRYYTSLVDSLPDTTQREMIVSHLINSPYNSIVLVNKQNKPTGFISIRDILQAITLMRPEEDIPLMIKKPSNSVTDKEYEKAIEHLVRFGKKLKKRMEIEKIEVAAEGPKKPNGDAREFNTTVIVTPVAGKAFVAVTKQRRFMDGIQEATKLIEKQRRRRGSPKKESVQVAIR